METNGKLGFGYYFTITNIKKHTTLEFPNVKMVTNLGKLSPRPNIAFI